MCSVSKTFHFLKIKNLYVYLDLPTVGEIVVEGESMKDSKVELVCPLDDPGHPGATQYLWMM